MGFQHGNHEKRQNARLLPHLQAHAGVSERHVVGETPALLVRAHVHLEIVRPRAGIVTARLRALVRLFAGVCPHMGLQVGGSSTRVLAPGVRTLERFLARVGSDVHLQGPRLGAGVVAVRVRALVVLFARVCADVTL